MELTISSEEVKALILEWANGKFPDIVFNTVEFSPYSYSREVTLSYVEPEVQELKAA